MRIGFLTSMAFTLAAAVLVGCNGGSPAARPALTTAPTSAAPIASAVVTPTTSSAPTTIGAPTRSGAPTTVSGPSGRLTVGFKSESARDPQWTISMRYPVVSGASSALAINSVIEASAQRRRTDFLHEAKSEPAPIKGDPHSELDLRSETHFPTPRILVTAVTTTIYVAGAAHPSTDLETHIFDVATGAEITQANSFAPGSNYLERFAAAARPQLATFFENQGGSAADVDDPAFSDGSSPTAENYRVWQPEVGGIRITFGQYQVAAYALGMPEVVVPWSALRSILVPNSPLAALAKG